MDNFKKRLLALMHDTARPMLSLHVHVDLIKKLGVSPEVEEHLHKMQERVRQVSQHLDKFYTDCKEVEKISAGTTAEDKVNELLTKFKSFNLTESETIQSCLFVVDEILNESKMKFCGEGITDPHYKFWESVKEILQLR